MNRREFLLSSAYLAGAASFRPTRANETEATPGNGLPRVRLSGNAYERGREYGRLLGERMRELSGAWLELLEKQTGMPGEAFVRLFLEQTAFPAAMRKWTPWLPEELRGMAEAADIKYDTLLAFNLPDELAWFGRVTRGGVAAPEPRGCTSLGFAPTPDRPAAIGQNMDIASGTKGFGVLLDVTEPEHGRRSLLFSVAGLVGIMGLSDAPVGVVNNSLGQLDGRPDGLPVNAVVRGLLAQPDYAEAVRFLREITHASGQNYIIGAPDAVSCWECSARGAVEFTAPRFPGAVYHTNHPFVSTDTALSSGPGAPPVDEDSSRARCAVVERRLAAAAGAFTLETMRGILCSRENADLPVSRPHDPNDPSASYTAASVVMELDPSPTLHLAPGPPAETPFETYRFS